MPIWTSKAPSSGCLYPWVCNIPEHKKSGDSRFFYATFSCYLGLSHLGGCDDRVATFILRLFRFTDKFCQHLVRAAIDN